MKQWMKRPAQERPAENSTVSRALVAVLCVALSMTLWGGVNAVSWMESTCVPLLRFETARQSDGEENKAALRRWVRGCCSKKERAAAKAHRRAAAAAKSAAVLGCAAAAKLEFGVRQALRGRQRRFSRSATGISC